MLKARALDAAIWSALEVLFRHGLQFLVTVIVARLLVPADFGLFSIAMMLVAVASVIADGGLSYSLIQRKDVSHTDESTVFWLQCILGLFVALGLYALAPYISEFYDQSQLILLIQSMAVVVLFGAIGAVQVSLLTKHLNFQKQALSGFFAVLLSGLGTIFMAFQGFGVWALVFQSVAMSVLNTSFLWLIGSWRPLCVIDIKSIDKLYGFGGYYFASNLLDVIYSRFYIVLVGKMYGVNALGHYVNADNLQQMPAGMLAKIFARVAFPVFSAVSHDKKKMKRGIQLAVRSMMFANVPVMFGMAVTADLIVDVLFGEQWAPSVPIFRILCLAGILAPVHVLNLNCLLAMGVSRIVFKNELLKKLCGIVFLIFGVYFGVAGVAGVAWSVLFLSVIGLLLNARFAYFFGFGLLAQLREILPILILGAVMAGVVGWLNVYWQAPSMLKLVCLSGFGGALYLRLAVIFQLNAFKDIFILFKMRCPNL